MTLNEFGRTIQAMREARGLTQDSLAEALSGINRTAVSLLEQGRRASPPVVQAVASHLKVPAEIWAPFANPEAQQRFEFESSLSELLGGPVSLDGHDAFAHSTANRLIDILFGGLTSEQAYDTLNAVLVLYNVRRCSRAFFDTFLGADAFGSAAKFAEGVFEFQKKAIRVYSTFADAYDHLNGRELDAFRAALQPRDLAGFRGRTDFHEIETIDEARLPMLGYISASTLERRRKEREYISDQLRKLAGLIERDGYSAAIATFPDKTKRKIDSLLRQLESSIQNGLFSPLFPQDPGVLRREAEALSPVALEEIASKKKTEGIAEANLSRYLASDHLDLYVATSMRTDADFISVNRFVEELVTHSEIRPLKLRYFNPTQSWIDDRVAKGLVEALMLRRAQYAIYMAQKTDSFGKDSEASVALGQGKAVIVYVPKLVVPEIAVDSEELGRKSKQELFGMLQKAGDKVIDELDATIDHEALHAQFLTVRLAELSNSGLRAAVRQHWADFDLYGEDERIKDSQLKTAYREWLDDVVKHEKDADPSMGVRKELEGIFISRATRFETRAQLFRDSHPLALQVIHSTGVINGLLVVRSLDACARVLRGLIGNDLEFDLKVDDDNYRLIERRSGSTVRVISKHALIRNGFSRYFERALGGITRS